MSRIPFVTEGTLDVASDINDSIKVIDGLVAGRVKGFVSTPPASPSDGDRWAIDENASGDWAGLGGMVALYESKGEFWRVMDSILAHEGTSLYISDGGSWTPIADSDVKWVVDDDPRLTNAREWIAPTVSEEEIEEGVSQERRAFTVQRVWGAVGSYVENNEDSLKLMLVGDVQSILDEILEGSV